MKKGQESSVVGRLGKGYPQIPQFQISPNYKHHIENLPIYPFKEEILETIEKVILNFLFLIYKKKQMKMTNICKLKIVEIQSI